MQGSNGSDMVDSSCRAARFILAHAVLDHVTLVRKGEPYTAGTACCQAAHGGKKGIWFWSEADVD